MIKHYLQIIFIFSSISILAGCGIFREAGDDFSTWINGSTQENQTASMQQAPQPAVAPHQPSANTTSTTNTNVTTPATTTGTTINKTTNVNPKSNIIPVTSEPIRVKPAPTPDAPTLNDNQNNAEVPTVRSTPNPE